MPKANHDDYQEYDLVIPGAAAPEEERRPAPEPEIEIEDESPEIEIEIEDDAPEQDRNRTPMPKPLLEELEADELDQYDDKVKTRLKQMRKVWHDERRAKEAVLREQQAALEYTRRVMAENQQLQQTLNAGTQEYAAMLKLTAQREMEIAKRAYKDAYEMGDSDAIMEAQNALQQANIRAMQAQQFKAPALQQPTNQVQPQQAPPQPAPARQDAPLDPKLVSWQERNSWYGSDDEMTAAALGLHEKLRRDGEVEIGSDEYYSVLDKTMRRRFPEHFGTQPATAGNRPSNVVAPAGRSTSPRRVRLTSSQVSLARKLGITPEQYAKEVKRMESENE